MTRRLVLAMTALAAIVAVALAIPLAAIVNSDQRTALIAQLEVDAMTTASIMASELQAQWDATATQTAQRTGARVVVVGTDLTLIADSDQSALDRTFDRPEIQSALAGQLSTDVRYSTTLGTDLRYVAAPIVQGRNVVAAVRLSLPESDVDAVVTRTRVSLIFFVLAVVVAAALIAWVIALSIAGPLRRVATVAQELPDDLELRANEKSGPPEVRSVAVALNRTAARLGGILRRQESVAADASHHLRTPLTGVRLRLEAIEDTAVEESVREDAAAALREVDRLSRRIEQVLALARSDAGQRVERVDLREIVADRVAAARSSFEAADIGLDVHYGNGDLHAFAPHGVVDRVVDELLGNARSYARSEVRVSVTRGSDGVTLSVADDGPGVSADMRDLIFERFKRGPSAIPGGSGLGLALVRESALSAGGDAVALASETGGLDVRTTWPAPEASWPGTA